MTHTITFTATAKRDLEFIPPRIVPAIVEFIYGDLAAHPRRVGKPLERELSGRFSARRGPYRVLYAINDEVDAVTILHIDHRSDVYRNG